MVRVTRTRNPPNLDMLGQNGHMCMCGSPPVYRRIRMQKGPNALMVSRVLDVSNGEKGVAQLGKAGSCRAKEAACLRPQQHGLERHAQHEPGGLSRI